VRLPDPSAGEAASNITLTVSNATSTQRIADVAFGDVIVCSGQSVRPRESARVCNPRR
jgi:hypothetical protein